LSLHAEPSKRWVDDEYLDKHPQSHNKRRKASAIAQDYHRGKQRLQECKDNESCPTTIEKKGWITRQNEVIGLQLINDMQSYQHSDKESQKEYRSIDEAIFVQYFEELFHHNNPYHGKNQAK